MKDPQRQVKLISGTTEVVCYLADHPGLRRGNSVTLRDHPEPDRCWEIVYVSPHVREKAGIRTRWHNDI